MIFPVDESDGQTVSQPEIGEERVEGNAVFLV